MFTYIIPVCNISNDKTEFNYRLKNLENIIHNLSIYKDLRIFIIEQIINENHDIFSYKIINKLEDSTSVMILKNIPHFNKSWLYNIGVKKSNTEYIILGEGDVLIDGNINEYFNNLYSFIKDNKFNWCFGWNKLIYLGENNEITKEVLPSKGMAEGGIVCFKKRYLESIGMLNEELKGLGGMDNELIRRAEFFTNNYPMFDYTLYHQYHPISKLKENSWINNKVIHDENIKIYNKTKKNPLKIIEKLNKIKQGVEKNVILNIL